MIIPLSICSKMFLMTAAKVATLGTTLSSVLNKINSKIGGSSSS